MRSDAGCLALWANLLIVTPLILCVCVDAKTAWGRIYNSPRGAEHTVATAISRMCIESIYTTIYMRSIK